MFITDYLTLIKIQLRDVYNFDVNYHVAGEPVFGSVPDGTYLIVVGGRRDNVVVKNNRIESFMNFEKYEN